MLSPPNLIPNPSAEIKQTGEPNDLTGTFRPCGVIYESASSVDTDFNLDRCKPNVKSAAENHTKSDQKPNKISKPVHKPSVNFDKVEVSKFSQPSESDCESSDKEKPLDTISTKSKSTLHEKLRKIIWSRKRSSFGASSITSNFKTSTSSLSTLSSIPSDSKYSVDPNATSPEWHLAKLKRIHTKVKRRKQWRRISKILYFLIFRVFLNFMLLVSFIFLLCGYFLNVRPLLIVGCILSLASAGCLVQLCFTKRTTPNKFNPSSVPFALAPEDLPNSVNLAQHSQTCIGSPIVTLSGPENQPVTPQFSSSTNGLNGPSQTVPTKPLAAPVVIGMDQVQARRISMALARVASGQLQTPRYNQGESSGVLNMARRLTMASSAMGMGHMDRIGMESNWLTGSRVRHGVRRSLAWNESGATRFYEHNYD